MIAARSRAVCLKTRRGLGPLLWLLPCLALEVLLLRIVRWWSIEEAKALSDPQLAALVSHAPLLKALLFVALSSMVVLARDLLQPVVRNAAQRPRSRVNLGAAHALCLGLLLLLLWGLPQGATVTWLHSYPVGVVMMATLLGLGWVGFVGTGAALLLPPLVLWDIVRRNAAAVGMIFSAALVYVLVQSSLVWFEALWSSWLLPPTVRIASALSAMAGLQVVTPPGTSQFGTAHFMVDIGPTCLGYQGVSILLFTLGGYLLANRESLRFPRALVVLPLAVVMLLLLNASRIAILVAIGSAWSPDVAVMGFHSTAGWVELILTLAIAVLLLTRWSVLRDPTDAFKPLRAPGDEIFLLPLTVLIGGAFVARLFTGGFYWAYPFPVLGAAMAIWWMRHRIRAPEQGGVGLAMGVGAVLCVLWVWLIEKKQDLSLAFGEQLFSAAPLAATVWLMARVLGAVVVVPVVEELAFRGYLQLALERFLGVYLSPRSSAIFGALLSALVFGIVHSAWLAGTLAGLGYALLFLRRRCVWDPILAHATTNLMLALYVVLYGYWSYW